MSAPNSFITELDVSPRPDGVNWVLKHPLRYIDPDGNYITIPAGFVTDFASIPPLSTIAGWVHFVALLGFLFVSQWFMLLMAFAWWVIMLADSFEHEGTWDHASALHDWLFATRLRSFTESNWLLFKAMRAHGGGRTALWKRIVIWLGVALGGWVAWQNDARKSANRVTDLH